jgi:hypothetical protein
VVRVYRSNPENAVPWSGKIGIFKGNAELLDMEAHWRVGANGPFVGLPRREYRTPDGERKWATSVWVEDKPVMNAITELLAHVVGQVRGYVPDDQQPGRPDDGSEDDLPF